METQRLCISEDQIKLLSRAFNAFDKERQGYISVETVGDILELLGWTLAPSELREQVDQVAIDGCEFLEFEEFCILAARFLSEEEDEDDENLEDQLKQVFRLYDKEDQGCISTDTLKEIFREVDHSISEDDLEDIMEQIDSDGSGTIDFQEFLEVMTL